MCRIQTPMKENKQSQMETNPWNQTVGLYLLASGGKKIKRVKVTVTRVIRYYLFGDECCVVTYIRRGMKLCSI